MGQAKYVNNEILHGVTRGNHFLFSIFLYSSRFRGVWFGWVLCHFLREGVRSQGPASQV